MINKLWKLWKKGFVFALVRYVVTLLSGLILGALGITVAVNVVEQKLTPIMLAAFIVIIAAMPILYGYLIEYLNEETNFLNR